MDLSSSAAMPGVRTWTGLSPQQALMCRTCRSSLARAFSLSLKRFSAARSLSSSSCSRLCCLCRRTSSPVAEAARGSLCAATGPSAAAASCCSSSKMESCLMTAAWRSHNHHRLLANTATSEGSAWTSTAAALTKRSYHGNDGCLSLCQHLRPHTPPSEPV